MNAVGYNGVACNLRNARSGQYLGVRNFWMVTKGAPKGAAAKFLAWVTSGKRAVERHHQLKLDLDSLRGAQAALDSSCWLARAPPPTGAPS